MEEEGRRRVDQEGTTTAVEGIGVVAVEATAVAAVAEDHLPGTMTAARAGVATAAAAPAGTATRAMVPAVATEMNG